METNVPSYSTEPQPKSRSTRFLVVVILILGILTLVQAGILLKIKRERADLPLSATSRFFSQVPANQLVRKHPTTPRSSDQPLVLWETTDDLEHIHEQINRLLRNMTATFSSPLAGGPFPGIAIQRDLSSPAVVPTLREVGAKAGSGSRPPAIPSTLPDLNQLHQEIERIFFEAYSEIRPSSLLSRANRGWDLVPTVAAMNIEDQGRNYLLTIALPGYDKQGISVSLAGRRLLIEAGQPPTVPTAPATHRKFHTEIMLPENIEGALAQAEYEDDFLRISIPKMAPTNALVRTIAIR